MDTRHYRSRGILLVAALIALTSAFLFHQTAAVDAQSVRPYALDQQPVSIPRDSTEVPRSLFVRAPADLSQVAVVIPRGNLNPPGGHIRPVKHMYLQYVRTSGGGIDSVEVSTMAGGEIVMVLQRQTVACVMPIGNGCALGPGATRLVDEYEIWIRHTEEVTSYFDHLHELDPGLGLPDWRDAQAGWVQVGDNRILFLGLNGARAPVRVLLGQRVGASRNYFGAWDIGVCDTRRIGSFLGSGLLRYPSLPEFLTAFAAEGGTAVALGPGQPFPGEMFVNSASFIDYMPAKLSRQWRAKLGGDGSGGRPDWDLAGTLQGNWYRAAVTSASFANMLATEDNSVSLSPYNLDPANKVQIGIGRGFFAGLPSTTDPLEIKIRERLSQGLNFSAETGTHQNSRPAAVGLSDYACYSIPVAPGTYSLLAYHQNIAGVAHLRLKYFVEPCATLLPRIALDPAQLETMSWSGDYVR